MRCRLISAFGLIAGSLVLAACGTLPVAQSPVTAPVVSEASSAAAPDKPADSHSDKGWRMTSVQLKDDGTGCYGGTLRAGNGNPQPMSATITLTVFKGGSQVAAMHGFANEVRAGQTVTVELVSEDAFGGAAGLTTQFQVDASF